MPWWKEEVFYQIYPRSFKDSNGDGVGDLRGIIEKLDYLEWLGIDVLWISPFFKSPMADFGYDISDYTDVDPLFGTVSDFEELVNEAHKRNLKIVIDQVYNHSSDQHPWFLESKSSRDNPKADWYIWKDPKVGGMLPPNNWVSLFSGGEKEESVWEWDDARKQYYLHLFGKEQPDLNWENPEVKKAIFDAMTFWLDKGVDGFRFDAASHYFKDPKFRDALSGPQIKESLFQSVRDKYYWDRFSGRPETFLAIEEIRDFLDSYPGEKVSVGEISADMGLCLYLLYTIPGRFNLAFNIDFMEKLSLDSKKVRELAETLDRFYGERAWPSYVLGNHDNRRIVSRMTEGLDLPKAKKKLVAKLFAAFLLTVRGTPFIYNGEELGKEDTEVPFERIADPWGKALWPNKGRDVARTPMQWNSGKNAGFSNAEPWLPVSDDREEVNVETEMKDPDSVLNFYRSLLKIRKENTAFKKGKLEFKELGEEVLAYMRQDLGEKMMVVLNFSDSQKEIKLDLKGHVILGTHRKNDRFVERNLVLEPFESIVMRV